VSNIYRFRMRVDPYTVTGSTLKSMDSVEASAVQTFVEDTRTKRKNGSDDNLSTIAKKSRMRFSEKVQTILRDMHGGAMSEDVFMGEDIEDGRGADVNERELLEHVHRSLYGRVRRQTRPKEDSRPHPKKSLTSEAIDALLAGEIATDTAEKSFWGCISTEGYLNQRIVPLIRSYRSMARRFFFWNWVMRLLTLIAGTAATLLAALGFKHWVPLSLSLGSTLAIAMSHFRAGEQLVALNESIGVLQNSVQFWHSLGIVDRRVHSTRERLVHTTEDAVLRVVEAATGMSVRFHGRGQGREENDHHEKKSEPRRDTSRFGS
jgi:hypothetical protein